MFRLRSNRIYLIALKGKLVAPEIGGPFAVQIPMVVAEQFFNLERERFSGLSQSQLTDDTIDG